VDLRRVALFFALSLLCIYLYSHLVHRFYGPPLPDRAAGGSKGAQPVDLPAEVPPPAEVVEVAAKVAEPAPEGQSVMVVTDLYRAEWTTTGGRLRGLWLRQYRTAVGEESPELDLIRSRADQELPVGLEIVPLQFSDASVAYDPDRDSLSLSGGEQGKIVFRGKGPGGVNIEKELRFQGNQYSIDLIVRLGAGVVNGSQSAVVRLTCGAEGEDHSRGGGWLTGRSTSHPWGVVVLDGRRLENKSFEELKKRAFEFAEPVWGGFGDQYFITVGVVGSGAGGRLVAERRRDGAPAVVRAEMPMVGVPAEAKMMLYLGPKDIDILEASGGSLGRAVDFGWFWFVALPLLRLIKAVHVVTGNYGLDIILVSTLIKILFLPLTKKSMVSMQEMQKLQPQMARLRERYKDDSQKLQKEMMELYRRHRVNPLSGCLPMLLQLPVFVGLYNALLSAIELRHAPFVWWVTDLSSPERLVIGSIGIPLLAIAMGVSMLVQQWMTPAAGDPTQRRMMMLMPVVFTFMFINFPSGLVLYWLVNNLLTIAQQYVLVKRTAG